MRHAWAAILLLTASLPLSHAYDGWVVLPTLLLAVALPAGMVALGRWLKLPAWVVAAAAGGLCTATALGVLRETQGGAPAVDLPAWRDSPGVSVLGPLIDAVPRLLTGPRPAAADAEMLTPVALLVALTTLAIFLLIGRDGRLGVTALVGAAVLYTAGALLTAGEADRYGVVALVVVVLAGAGWVLFDRSHHRTRADRAVARRVAGRRGALLAGAGGMAVVGSVALVAAALPNEDSFEPREHITPPMLNVETASPLPMLGLWGEQSDLELFRVRGQAPERLGLVALPDFDGVGWRVDTQFRPLGAVGEPDLRPGAYRGGYDMAVEIIDLEGMWLPAAGTPEASSLSDGYVDLDTGAMLRPDGVHEGLRYALRGQVDQAPASVRRTAGLAAAVPDRYLAVPGLPAPFAEYAASATEYAESRFDQAVALETLVRTGRTLDPLAPVGSSYARLQDFLFGDEGDPGAQSGTGEQFAAAFVVLARSLGLPSRLVVGFDVPTPDGDGVSTVYGRHATAWPEVYLSQVGWLAFDPTPSDRDAGDGDREAITGPEEEPDDGEPESGREDDATPQPTPEPSAAGENSDGADETSSGLGVATVVAGSGGVLAAAAMAIVVLRTLRRARHRRAGAMGAWNEVLDSLWLAGHRPAASLTAPDIASDLVRLAGGREGPVQGSVGGEQAPNDGDTDPDDHGARVGAAAVSLASLADRAAFGPAPSAQRTPRSPGGSAPGAGGGRPWALAVTVTRATRRHCGIRRRLLWWLDPRVLRR
ncbi:transglutaminase domain-containing protein [Phytoactinopolyspora endophytica]|uniref:transglutaminase domain-containing protein n=1 Tax=Phytoactinopolyspora endophytica TaxID=1642495 RepID=UPI00101D2553|nr:transglutaminase domain-containing protein [Phytoactinopolyspora endophytica]